MGTKDAGSAPAVVEAQPVPEWQMATVKAIGQETARVRTFTLVPEHWVAHRAGQHYDVRAPGADGQLTRRSYSIASEPERAGEFDLAVERLEQGEVSAYMHDVLRPGSQIEVRGPLGQGFIWEANMGGPLLMVAGGTGVTPLMAILRHRAAAHSSVTARLLYSVRALEEALYTAELARLGALGTGLEVVYTVTRSRPVDWSGYQRRADARMLRDMLLPLSPTPLAYVCGPTAFVEIVANTLVDLGLPPERVRTEYFRPTGLRGPE